MSTSIRAILAGIALSLALAALPAAPATAKVLWLCHPELASDPCRPKLSTTVFRPFGTEQRVERHERLDVGVDCFYVYPTVSDQEPTQAEQRREPAVRDIARFQVSRFSELCRVYAPVYRQITVRGLMRGDATPAQVRSSQADVVEAFKRYLRRDNDGRGIVLVGHSQGTLQLVELIRREVDRRPAVRRKLVFALLLGGNVTVRRGSDRDGVFANVPACRRPGQLGCVVAFSAYGATPPDDARFGRGSNRFAEVFGQPRGEDLEVLCTNPAALRGGSARLDAILPSRPFAPGTLIVAGIALLDFPVPDARTTFIAAPGAFSGRCVRENGATVLKVRSRGGTPTPKASPDATWGLHLVDANIAQGDLLELVRRQAGAHLRR